MEHQDIRCLVLYKTLRLYTNQIGSLHKLTISKCKTKHIKIQISSYHIYIIPKIMFQSAIFQIKIVITNQYNLHLPLINNYQAVQILLLIDLIQF